jgi:predicted Na+-dependent transporter
MKSMKGLAAAIVSSLGLYPVIAWLLSSLLPYPELVVGCLILATAPTTISSGTILTAFARGNVAFSVFICIATHFIGVLTIPLLLNLFLGAGAGVELPVLSIFSGLALKVLLPLSFGQFIKPAVGKWVKKFTPAISIFQSLLILLMILTAVARSAGSLNQMAGFLIIVALAVGVLHFIMVLLNYLLARAIRLDYETLVAFTIHAPQKTLAVSFIVWSGCFAAEFPGAFVPAIFCHLLQMITGTLIARKFIEHAKKREPDPG